ncbi:MAG: fumarylacetoacetate hydrolase family protein [Hyphomonadaceae bacterium]|nr:fumarylacetoacetate hydrolase family protein [Hyphomonadaceae bacterium]
MSNLVENDPRAIAARFVEARLAGRALPDYPGAIPADLAGGYAVQEHAIASWPDEIGGWKIGRVPADQVERLGAVRLSGPIFRRSIWIAKSEQTVEFPIYRGGFAAAEAEIVFRCARDAPADKLDWTLEEASEMVAAAHIGIETAGSPLAAINDLGATVVVSDFGNNAGLVLGPVLADWRNALEDLTCVTAIDGVVVGEGSPAPFADGPVESLRFLLMHLAARGRPLRAGSLISTGALTGVHDIRVGQTARCTFGALGVITCKAISRAISNAP